MAKTRTQLSAIVLAFTSVFAAQAMAATDAPVTREQVRAELAEAKRTGNMLAGESSQTWREINPNNYPAQHTSTLTRSQVLAELAEAKRAGNVLIGESSTTLAEAYPQNYPAQQHFATKSRDQVRMELAEAAANGVMDRHIEA